MSSPNKTMLLLSGGERDSTGINIFGMDQHPDYHDFLTAVQSQGWTCDTPSGLRDLETWYSVIDSYGDRGYNVLMGHSAGGMLAMMYAEDNPVKFNQVILFNVPLIYLVVPTGWVECYQRARNIKANTLLVMSKNDPVLGQFNMNGVTIQDATDYVERTSNMQVRVLDIAGYGHSPFAPSIVALDIFKEKSGVTWQE